MVKFLLYVRVCEDQCRCQPSNVLSTNLRRGTSLPIVLLHINIIIAIVRARTIANFASSSIFTSFLRRCVAVLRRVKLQSDRRDRERVEVRSVFACLQQVVPLPEKRPEVGVMAFKWESVLPICDILYGHK